MIPFANFEARIHQFLSVLTKEFKVALLAIISGTILYVGFNFLKGRDFMSSKDTFYVVYDNVSGLVEGNPVTTSGLSVGRVEAIEPIMTETGIYHMKVTLSVDESIDVGDATVAILNSASLLGGMEIALEMGKNTEVYQGGETISGSTALGVAEKLQAKAMPVVERVDTVLATINDTTRENIRGILSNVELMTAELAKASNRVDLILAQNQKKIDLMTQNLNVLIVKLNGTVEKMDPLLEEYTAFGDTLNHMQLTQTVAEAKVAVTNLNSVLEGIEKGEGTAGKLMKDEAVYQNLEDATIKLNDLLADMKANPERYVNVDVSVFEKKSPKEKYQEKLEKEEVKRLKKEAKKDK